MSQSEYKEHPVRATLQRMRELLDGEKFASPDVFQSEEASFSRDKIRNIVKSLRTQIEQTPATLASIHALHQINSNLQAPLNELTAFEANSNPAHLKNAVAQIEQNVMPYSWGFAPRAISSSKAIAEIVDEQQAAAHAAIEEIFNQRQTALKDLSELSEKIEGAKIQLEELSKAQAAERAKLTLSVSNLESEFIKSQTSRDTRFKNTLEKITKEVASDRSKLATESKDAIEALERYKAQAAQLLQVVGNITVTGNYKKIAAEEAEQANIWRYVTVALFTCGIALAAATFWRFYHEPVTTLNIGAIAVRLLYALAITAPAFYTARESARHRTNADRAKQTELELASIGPFIELLPDEKKNEIREKLVSQYFGNGVEAHTVSLFADPALLQNIVDALKKTA